MVTKWPSSDPKCSTKVVLKWSPSGYQAVPKRSQGGHIVVKSDHQKVTKRSDGAGSVVDRDRLRWVAGTRPCLFMGS